MSVCTTLRATTQIGSKNSKHSNPKTYPAEVLGVILSLLKDRQPLVNTLSRAIDHVLQLLVVFNALKETLGRWTVSNSA